ncbi:MAG: hypothetical protein EOQ92_14445 [Mesorhizobium sp.]|nr:MAG: hypothetical protein EOQ92_14445 [Mesorhizobium sp.]RWK47910.1 MAG: hypothetical protein EOR47_19910 [Mesorhizobium sp.]RWK93721.1 MAG: hypothetical protein EOR53_21720 [Mesorhizobium sp.]TIQ21697.1 MAG: hypothetical protein E5X51_10780 [Mesorhizobium sp.]TIQ32725.1 MAG: hypothetical protein E5X54_02415 [Mesorhizobium sp.]
MACIDVISKTGPFIPQGNRFSLALPLTDLPSRVGGWRQPAQHPISPLAGEMSGRTEGGGKDRQLLT